MLVLCDVQNWVVDTYTPLCQDALEESIVDFELPKGIVILKSNR